MTLDDGRALPDLDTLVHRFEGERVRAHAATDARTLPAVAAAIAAAAAIGAVIWWFGLPLLFMGIAVMPAMAAWRWRAGPRKRYVESVKDEAFPAALQELGPEWRYQRQGRIDLRALRRSGIVPGFDKERQQDLLAGPWEGLGVEMVEARLTERRGTGKNRRDVTTFDGLVVRFTGLSQLHGRIVLKRRFATVGPFSSLERVRLETSPFEKEFNVYADDQIGARTLLTVTVMDRFHRLSEDLMRLGGGAQAQRLEAAFYDDTLLVMVPCRSNLFEPRSMTEPFHVRQDLERLIAEVRDVLRIAEALRLGSP